MRRPDGATADQLVAVDATSAAGGLPWDPTQVDVYYFAPQKCFAADGGLWLAACSPAAAERIERIAASDRWRPASIDLGVALANIRQDQTYNTPAVTTLVLLDDQIAGCSTGRARRLPCPLGGIGARLRLGRRDGRRRSSTIRRRSDVVATIDLDGRVDANRVNAALRNGIVDTDSYRKLGRNQLRIGALDRHADVGLPPSTTSSTLCGPPAAGSAPW